MDYLTWRATYQSAEQAAREAYEQLAQQMSKTHMAESALAKANQIIKKSGWIALKDKAPSYGEPVLIIANGVVQNMVYMRDGADDQPDWFAPHAYNDCPACYLIDYSAVSHWIYVSNVPTPVKERLKNKE